MGIDNDSLKNFQDNYPIDYKKIFEAIEYYKKKGFTYIELPWDVPDEYRRITFSGEDFNQIADDRYLLGSAEQAFVMMANLKKIKFGSYVACTPCFRNDEIDNYHQKYFLKVELFDTNDTSEKRLIHIVKTAKEFLNNYIPVDIIQTDIYSYDIITIFGLELGSYGIREYNNIKWIYGTGLAEPRLSKSMLAIN